MKKTATKKVLTQIKKGTVRLVPSAGYLCIPADLLPENFDRKNLRFEVKLVSSDKKVVHLRPIATGGGPSDALAYVLKAWFSNAGGLAAYVSWERMSRILGLVVNGTADYPAVQMGAGLLTVYFQ